eukprot:2176038-Rhodomonas_salina.2
MPSMMRVSFVQRELIIGMQTRSVRCPALRSRVGDAEGGAGLYGGGGLGGAGLRISPLSKPQSHAE